MPTAPFSFYFFIYLLRREQSSYMVPREERLWSRLRMFLVDMRAPLLFSGSFTSLVLTLPAPVAFVVFY